MAVVTHAYAYPTGTVLVPDSHNANIYSSASGVGIVSEPNGGIENANLAPGFTILAEHVQRGEQTWYYQDWGLEDLDYMDSAFGSTTERDFAPIAGSSARVYVPYAAASGGIYEWQLFLSPWRVMEVVYNGAGAVVARNRNSIVLRVEIDGNVIDYTRRVMPVTVAVGTAPAAANDYLRAVEDRACRTWTGHHFTSSVTKGWHSLDVTLYVEKNTVALVDFARSAAGPYPHEVHQRLTVGIRNAGLIVFR